MAKCPSEAPNLNLCFPEISPLILGSDPLRIWRLKAYWISFVYDGKLSVCRWQQL